MIKKLPPLYHEPFPKGKSKEKSKFFIIFASKLQKKYNTPECKISFKEINCIRSLLTAKNLNKKQIIEFCDDKMFDNKDNRKHSIAFYLHISNFVKKCPEEALAEIGQEIIFQQSEPISLPHSKTRTRGHGPSL